MEEGNQQAEESSSSGTNNDRRLASASGGSSSATEVHSRVERSAVAAGSNGASNPQARLRQQAHASMPSINHLPDRPSPNRFQAPLQRVSAPSPVAAQRILTAGEQERLNILPRAQPVNQDLVIPEHEADDDSGTVCNESNQNEVFGPSGWSQVDLGREPGGAPSIVPSPRSLHAGAVLNGALYIFGGYDGTQRVNTFHAFSFIEKRWSPVLPSPHSQPPPGPRDRHVAFVFGNSFYVHGGFNGHSRVSDMFGFDFSTMTWREINTSGLTGRVPSPRHSHSAVVYGHSVFIAFGYDGSYKSDIHEYDFVSSRWSAVAAAGRRPRARYRATTVVHKNYMLVFGGHDGVRHLSDINVFDIDTKTWSNLVTEGPAPMPRDSHVSCMHGNSMFVFAGSTGSAMNDFYELQLPAGPLDFPATARWRPIKSSTRDFEPRPRFCHVGAVYDGSLYCFGGYDGRDRLNDFVRFDFTVYDLSFEVPPSSLVSDLRAMINNSSLSDVTFIVEGQPVCAHKLMLMRCPYFEALFLCKMRESRMTEIPISQVSYSVFISILEYLYTDQVKMSTSNAMDIFVAADLFCIPRLKTMCEKHMLQSITVDNAAAIFHAADMHSATALRQKAKKYIVSHFEEVSKSSTFEEMGRNNIELVFELLQSR